MGSVAAELRERGFNVTGSDENIYPPMSIFLEKKGIALKEGYRAENIPADVDVVVVGNAIKRGNPEVEAVLNRKLFYLSLPEVLKIISCAAITISSSPARMAKRRPQRCSPGSWKKPDTSPVISSVDSRKISHKERDSTVQNIS